MCSQPDGMGWGGWAEGLLQPLCSLLRAFYLLKKIYINKNSETIDQLRQIPLSGITSLGTCRRDTLPTRFLFKGQLGKNKPQQQHSLCPAGS